MRVHQLCIYSVQQTTPQGEHMRGHVCAGARLC